jgi:hypothetical protein
MTILLTPDNAIRLSLLTCFAISIASYIYILLGPAELNLWLVFGSALVVIAIGLGARAISWSARDVRKHNNT